MNKELITDIEKEIITNIEKQRVMKRLVADTILNINMSLTQLNCILTKGIDIRLEDGSWGHVEPNQITFDFARKLIIFLDTFNKSKDTGKMCNHTVNFDDELVTWRTIWV